MLIDKSSTMWLWSEVQC